MRNKHKLSQKHKRHTIGGASTESTRQQLRLTEEKITGLLEKLRPHRHNPYIVRLYAGLIPN